MTTNNRVFNHVIISYDEDVPLKEIRLILNGPDYVGPQIEFP